MNLLFVCTGNTCRSPLAEVIARAEAERRDVDVTSRSAGTIAFSGQPAAGPGREVAARHELDLDAHVSRELSIELLEWADVVIGMDAGHVDAATRLDASVPAHLMSDFLPANHALRGHGVPDPFGGDLDAYLATYVLLSQAMTGLFDAFRDVVAKGGGPER
ncbi:MAG: low molecular weight protein arginine phosphatase [Gemmatimonadetes bacterium]|nr:low molecular weight protein arginine phosphatase [Gemmatimonadota bacterium]